jgi:HlyD family secretion protein
MIGLVAMAAGTVVFYGTWFRVEGAVSSADKNRTGIRSTSVAALGRIEPHSEIINLGAGAGPDRLESLFVTRGDRVKKGQILGYLGGYAEQAAQREVFRSQLAEVQLRLRTEVELNRKRIEAAETYRKQILEVSPLKIAAQEAAIASLEANLANNEDILGSHEQLYSRGASSRRLQDNQKTLVMQGKADLNAARANLAALKQQFEVDKVDAELRVQLARAALERAEAEFPVASLKMQIEAANARAEKLTLYAPIDGRILNIRSKPGEQIGSDPILTMGDTDKMRAVAEVYETDIAQVEVGQRATIMARVLQKPIHGVVARIGHLVFKNDVLNVDPAARADARVVEVWIDLEDNDLLKRLTNLTVDIIIDTSRSDSTVMGSTTP